MVWYGMLHWLIVIVVLSTRRGQNVCTLTAIEVPLTGRQKTRAAEIP